MKKKQRIETILFDFDGTIANTIPLIIRSFRETLSHFLPDQPFSQAEIHDFIGPTLNDTFSSILPDKKDEMIAFYRKSNRLYHAEMVELYPYVKEDLELLKALGYQLAIVSSKQRDVIQIGLDQFDIGGLFDLVISNNDVTNPKPHPEPIELALHKLNKTKEQVIFVGDTSHDIHCGRNAGVLTCGVAWSFRGANYLKEEGADCILERVKDIVSVIEEVKNLNGKFV